MNNQLYSKLSGRSFQYLGSGESVRQTLEPRGKSRRHVEVVFTDSLKGVMDLAG